MITQRFYIPKERLDDYKKFIRTLPTARFVHNPVVSVFSKEAYLAVSFETNEDSGKFQEYENMWYEIDNPKPIPHKSFIASLKEKAKNAGIKLHIIKSECNAPISSDINAAKKVFEKAKNV